MTFIQLTLAHNTLLCKIKKMVLVTYCIMCREELFPCHEFKVLSKFSTTCICVGRKDISMHLCLFKFILAGMQNMCLHCCLSPYKYVCCGGVFVCLILHAHMLYAFIVSGTGRRVNPRNVVAYRAGGNDCTTCFHRGCWAALALVTAM